MTNPIRLSGALNMISTNGDGPQLLTEAAEFVNALAQMGVTLIVEINLRPFEAAPAKQEWDLTPHPPKPAPTIVAAHDIPAPTVDPTPAGPAAPEYPLMHALENGETSWRKLSRDERRQVAAQMLRFMQAPSAGRGMSQGQYEKDKPEWMPGAQGLWNLFGHMNWVEMLKRAWDGSLT